MEKEQYFIFTQKKVQTVYNTQKKFSFSSSATYFFEGWPSHTQNYANMYINSKAVDF